MTIRSPFAELFVTGCDILASTISTTGAILVQLGDAINSSVESNDAEWWQHTGFRSIPAAPTAGAASCQQIGIRRGNHDMNFASKDERHAAMWRDLKPDEAEIYSSGGNCRIVARSSGTVEIGTVNPTDAAGLASKIDQAVSTIVNAFNTHTHPAPGGATSAPAVPISPAPPTVASSTVKVST
jgi:hypothetical protein